MTPDKIKQKIDNKKIVNISFKEPYNVLSKIENKSDFNSVRRERDSGAIISPLLPVPPPAGGRKR